MIVYRHARRSTARCIRRDDRNRRLRIGNGVSRKALVVQKLHGKLVLRFVILGPGKGLAGVRHPPVRVGPGRPYLLPGLVFRQVSNEKRQALQIGIHIGGGGGNGNDLVGLHCRGRGGKRDGLSSRLRGFENLHIRSVRSRAANRSARAGGQISRRSRDESLKRPRAGDVRSP